MKSLVKFAQFRSADNVEYRVKHCRTCAAGLECSLRGTYHGTDKLMFQENFIAKALLKAGKLSPDWINSRFAFLYMLALGNPWANAKVIGNLVTNAGFAGSAGRFNGSGAPAAFTWIAMGTGTTAAAVTDTALQTELAASGLSRVNATVSLVTTGVTNDTAQLQNTFTVTGTVAVTESGILNAASVGTLAAHQVFSAINVVNGDSLQVTWKVQMH